tara:strand:+ start:850 stop:1086 length:237 start_codon:yes stop_codon:yes gene_type:complete
MNYYQVVNRTTRAKQIFNAKELERFTRLNNFRDYAITNALSPKDKKLNTTLDTIALSFFSVGAILFITELIRNNYTIL